LKPVLLCLFLPFFALICSTHQPNTAYSYLPNSESTRQIYLGILLILTMPMHEQLLKIHRYFLAIYFPNSEFIVLKNTKTVFDTIRIIFYDEL